MTLGTDLKRSIRKSLKGLKVVGLSKKNVCDLYELYILSLYLQSAMKTGATLRHVDRLGVNSNILTCPTSPRAIGKGPYTHFIVTYANKPELEAHLGIYYFGQSKVLHECDVSLLDQKEAIRCRAATTGTVTVHPDYKKLMGFAECKGFETARLTIGHGRAFLGLCAELHHGTTVGMLVSTKKHAAISILLKAYKRVFASEIQPGNEAQLVNAMEDVFNTFKK